MFHSALPRTGPAYQHVMESIFWLLKLGPRYFFYQENLEQKFKKVKKNLIKLTYNNFREKKRIL